MMNCSQCGKEISEDSEFCPFCGAATAAAAASAGEAGQPPVPPGTQPAAPPQSEAVPPPPPTAPPPGPAMQPGPYAPPAKKKSALPWVVGGLVLAVIAAVVLVLVFVVFKDGGTTDTSGPEKVVEEFYESMERQDAELLLSTMEPSFRSEIEDALGEDYMQLIEDYFFIYFPEDFEVTIREMDTEIDGDTAMVTILEGTISYTDDTGETISEEASEADLDPMELVRIDGKWYLSSDTLIDFGFDLRDLEDLSLEDMEDLEDTGLEDGASDNGSEDTTASDGTADGGLEDEFTQDDFEMGIVDLPVDSEEEVLTLILEDPEIWDWFISSDTPLYELTDENTSYVVYLYEIGGEGAETPFGWYAVDKETGEVFEVVE